MLILRSTLSWRLNYKYLQKGLRSGTKQNVFQGVTNPENWLNESPKYRSFHLLNQKLWSVVEITMNLVHIILRQLSAMTIHRILLTYGRTKYLYRLCR